jgi:hypothetical protein
LFVEDGDCQPKIDVHSPNVGRSPLGKFGLIDDQARNESADNHYIIAKIADLCGNVKTSALD